MYTNKPLNIRTFKYQEKGQLFTIHDSCLSPKKEPPTLSMQPPFPNPQPTFDQPPPPPLVSYNRLAQRPRGRSDASSRCATDAARSGTIGFEDLGGSH